MIYIVNTYVEHLWDALTLMTQYMYLDIILMEEKYFYPHHTYFCILVRVFWHSDIMKSIFQSFLGRSHQTVFGMSSINFFPVWNRYVSEFWEFLYLHLNFGFIFISIRFWYSTSCVVTLRRSSQSLRHWNRI